MLYNKPSFWPLSLADFLLHQHALTHLFNHVFWQIFSFINTHYCPCNLSISQFEFGQQNSTVLCSTPINKCQHRCFRFWKITQALLIFISIFTRLLVGRKGAFKLLKVKAWIYLFQETSITESTHLLSHSVYIYEV